jgi:hypothetical protein
MVRIMKKTSGDLAEVHKRLIQQTAEKLSVAIGKTQTGEELIKIEEEAFKNEVIATEKSIMELTPVKGETRDTPSTVATTSAPKTPPPPEGLSDLFTSNHREAQEKRADLTYYLLGAAALGWVAMLFFILTGR